MRQENDTLNSNTEIELKPETRDQGKPKMNSRTLHRKSLNRRGAATVELALCLPMLLLIAFGAVEGASMIFLKQALVQSAYEGAKVAIKPNATNADIAAATQSVLGGRSLTNAVVTINPTNIGSAERGDLIIITVSAPSDANSVFPFGPFQGRTVSSDAVMIKE